MDLTKPPNKKQLQALADLQVLMDRSPLPWKTRTAPHFLHIGAKTDLCTWYVGHPTEGSHCELKLKLPMNEGETRESIHEKMEACRDGNDKIADPEWFRLFSRISDIDIGWARTNGEAIAVAELLAAAPAEYPSTEEMLNSAGFHKRDRSKFLLKPAETDHTEEDPSSPAGRLQAHLAVETEFWELPVGKGRASFTCRIGAGHVHLSYEPGGPRWHNIMHLHWEIVSYDRKLLIPRPWPANIKDPRLAAVHVAMEMTRRRLANGPGRYRFPSDQQRAA